MSRKILVLDQSNKSRSPFYIWADRSEFRQKGFYCYRNNLTTLENCPKIIKNRYFSCFDNQLTSLKGCSKIINGDFDCEGNKLTSLEDFPRIVNGNFWIRNNTKKFTEKEINSVCNVTGDIYV